MIRRHVGDEFFLIAQNEHAHLSGLIAARFGNSRFERPRPWEQTLQAIGMHDGGWVEHDDHPTLNKEGLPLDVFETPLELSLRLWHGSIERAAGEALHTQFLVSLHVLGLSGLAASRPRTARETFELNKFQQREIERQEELRRKIGLPLDMPLRLGLSERTGPPDEEELKQSHQLMQICDRLSLALCCTTISFDSVDNVRPRVREAAVKLKLTPFKPAGLRVNPWPFDEPLVSLTVPYRAMPARPFADVEAFRAAYAAAEKREMHVELRAM